MKKSKEYLQLLTNDFPNAKLKGISPFEKEIVIDMNHKTLKDVEDLIINRIQKYASEPHANNEPRRFELIEILAKLKSLKL